MLALCPTVMMNNSFLMTMLDYKKSMMQFFIRNGGSTIICHSIPYILIIFLIHGFTAHMGPSPRFGIREAKKCYNGMA